jgi:hypothetical protein
MGGSSSKLGLAGIPVSRDSLLKSTEPLRLLMDQVLRMMLDKFTREDLRRLQSSAECSKYVVLIGNAFDQYFQSIDVLPVMKKGHAGKSTIYFQRADVLTSTASTGDRAMDEKLRTDRALVCKSIAYFYTRLFQIISALAYSIFDNASVRHGATGYGGPTYGILPTQMAARPMGGPALLRGGEVEAFRGTSREPFADIFTDAGRDDIYNIYSTKADSSEKNILLKIPRNPLNKKLVLSITSASLAGVQKTVELYITTSKDSNDNYDVTVKGGILKDADNRVIAIDESPNFNSRLQFKMYKTYYDPQRIQYTTNKHIEGNYNAVKLTTILHYLLVHVRNYLETRAAQDGRYREQPVLKSFWGRERDEYMALIGKPTGQAQVQVQRNYRYGVPAQVAAPAQNAQALLSQTRPVAHCIARALQLLNIDIVNQLGGKKAWSFVCEPRFMASGIPLPNQSITNSAGIKSMDMLYTVFRDGIAKAMTSEDQEYMDALNRMNLAFTGAAASGAAASGAIRKMDNITNKADKACKQQGTIKIEDQAVIDAYMGAQNLWKYQIEHAKKVDVILRQLFVKDRAGVLHINPQLLRIGVIGLDMIAETSRKVLLDYYTNCETIYQSAADKIRGTAAGPAAGPAAGLR